MFYHLGERNIYILKYLDEKEERCKKGKVDNQLLLLLLFSLVNMNLQNNNT
jgi:hypothetical protein